MKKLLFILIFAFSVSAQTPRTVYNKTKLVGIYGLENCAGKSRSFAGTISRALVSESASEYSFDLGKEVFWLGYANLGESDKARLSDFVKQGNRVSVTGCSQKNGVWRVVNMKLR